MLPCFCCKDMSKISKKQVILDAFAKNIHSWYKSLRRRNRAGDFVINRILRRSL